MRCHPLRYERECGPGVLAAIAGLPQEEAAALLWPLRSPPLGAPPIQGDGSHGTWPHDLGEAFTRLGYDVALFDGAGVEWAEPAAYRALLARRAERGVREVRRIPAEPPKRKRGAWSYATPVPGVPGISRAPKAEYPRRLTVAAWLRTFPGSTWVLLVTGHALAAERGKIIAGGEGYGRYAVRDALRITLHTEQDNETH